MVLVSKLRGQSTAQPGGNNSLLGKIRSTLTRSSSSTNLKVVSDCNARKHAADSYSCVERFDESTSCGSSSEKRSELHDPCDWPVDNMVVLADLESEPHSVPEVSICGSPGDRGAVAEDSEPDLDAEPLSSRGSLHRPVGRDQAKPAAEGVPGAVSGEESNARSGVDAKPAELKGRLWDPADPPKAQAHAAWQIGSPPKPKRETEVSGANGSKTRFPARLPPLSGLATKGLRKLGSTPVLQVSNLPEPAPLQLPSGEQAGTANPGASSNDARNFANGRFVSGCS